jgi:4-hydroxybenzoyl-CoA thioesterase
MFNEVVERWFDEALGCPFGQLHEEWAAGVPLVNSECQFRRPNHLGDSLDFSLQVSRLGQGSFTLDIEGSHEGVSCVTARLTMVWVSLGERLQSSPVPIDIRQLMSAYTVAPDEMEPSA